MSMAPQPGTPKGNSSAVQSLFLRALSLDENDRIPFLRGQSGVSADLIDEAEKLLAIVSSGSTPGDPTSGNESDRSSRAGGLDVPSRIDGYQLIRPIGEGGMGRVFLARDIAREQDVALKILRPSLFTPESHGRFEKEVRIHQQLDHPSIVKFLSSGVVHHPIGNLCYLATEYVDGPNVREYVQSRAPSDLAILELMADVCDAAHHAHEQGIVHRDLKPSNILVDRFGKPKILDFGLARMLDPARQNASQVTASGFLIGTLRYMSPEQARADSTLIGPRSDQYSIGVVAFELLAGRLPYPIRGEETFARVIAAILTAEPELLSLARKASILASDLDPGHETDLDPAYATARLDPVLAQAMARTPEDRYETCSALARDLRRVASGKAPRARAPTPPRGEPAPHFERDPARSVNATARRRVRSVLLAAFLLGVVVTAFGLVTRHQDRPEDALPSIYAALAEAERNIHLGSPTDSTLRRTVGILQGVRQSLVSLPQDAKVGHLMRFANWRLGECQLVLGHRADDVGQLKLARASWSEASGLPFDLQIGEKISTSLPFYGPIVGDGMHIPLSGMGGIEEGLALYESPASHLRAARISRRAAFDQQSRPIRQNYTTIVESLNVVHNRGLVLNEFGSSLCRLGWVVDSLGLVQEGMRKYAAAELVPDFINFRDPYASFLSNYALGYAIRAELSSNPADVDSALVRYQESMWFQDASLGVGSVQTRQRIAAAHILAAKLGSSTMQNEHWQKAEALLTRLRKDVERAKPLVRIEQGLLEARLFHDRARELARGDGPEPRSMHSSPIHADQLGTHLENDTTPALLLIDQAASALSRSDSTLVELPYPTPTANVSYEKARLAVLRADLFPSAENAAIAQKAIETAKRAIGVVDYPAHHRRLRELSAHLP